jgi:DHA1 family tetracycline resistance protein-like MFS transporter
VFLSRIIDGITGGNISIASAYMADITDSKNRAKGMGLLGAAFGLGFMIGPAVGGLLSSFGFWVPALAAATMSTLAAVCTYIFLPETVNTKTAINSPKTNFSLSQLFTVLQKQPLGLLIIAFFLINLAFAGMQGTFALWTQKTYGWGPARVGLQFTYIGILSILAQVKLVPYAVKRYGERSVMVNAIPFLALGLFLIPLALQPWVLLVVNLLIVIGNSLSGPTLQAIATETVSPAEYGGILGLLQSAGSLGRIFGPILGGQLFYLYNKDIPYFVSSFIMFGTYLLLNHYLPPNRTWFSRLFRR